jgi:hypothetical protein
MSIAIKLIELLSTSLNLSVKFANHILLVFPQPVPIHRDRFDFIQADPHRGNLDIRSCGNEYCIRY